LTQTCHLGIAVNKGIIVNFQSKRRVIMRYVNRIVLCVLFCFSPMVALAGTLDDPAAPTSADSAMYTLENIYNRLDSNTQATKRSGVFTEPSAAPGSTGHTLDQVYEKAIPTQVPKTGQTDCYYTNGKLGSCTCGTDNCTSGQDGDLEKGVEWPNPRFSNNGDGTVTDNLTGLIWLQDANCTGNTVNWTHALSFANGLADGNCGLTDGSSAGDWRLPNLRELFSLADLAFTSPALSNDAGTGKWTDGAESSFTGVQWGGSGRFYWSSTTHADYDYTDYAWDMNFADGGVFYGIKDLGDYVWPVRGGQ
jgi:hypothetical protein